MFIPVDSLRRASLKASLCLLALFASTSCSDSSTAAQAPSPRGILKASELQTPDSVEAALALPMEQLIAFDAHILLSQEEEDIRRAALTAIPAPCCKDNTAYTCCCPCNLARAWWGLSKLLITEHGQNAAEVQANVERWIADLRPEGFPGNSCYTGMCTTAAKDGGCSGMSPNHIVG